MKPRSLQSEWVVAILALLWLQTDVLGVEGAALGRRPAPGNPPCGPVSCEDDEPGKFNCGSRRLSCIPNSHTDGIRVLDLHGNLLTNLIERSFSHYRQLQNLDLSMNEIGSIAPGAFTGLANLTRLILKLNRLQALSSGAFTGALQLRTLDLSLNNITLIQPGTFTGLASLRQLFLQGNHIQLIDRGALFGLDALGVLALESNRIRRIDRRSLDGLGSLRTLRLSDNQLASLPDLSFLLPTLRDIWISGNPIHCDCRIEFLRRGIVDERGTLGLHISQPILCARPPALVGADLRFLKIPLVCERPTITEVLRSVKAVRGQSAVLSCNATGIPEPVLTWTDPRGAAVTSRRGERVAQLDDGSLRIADVRQGDGGNYTCRAENEQGSDLARFALTVSQPPSRTGSDAAATATDQGVAAETHCGVGAPGRAGGTGGEGGDAAVCPPDEDGTVICDSTAGIIATALVTFSTTLSTALVLFYVWHRRQSERKQQQQQPRVPGRTGKQPRAPADGEEACLEIRDGIGTGGRGEARRQAFRSRPESHTFQRMIHALTAPKALYAKPARRSRSPHLGRRPAAPIRMNKVEDLTPKHGRYIALGHLRGHHHKHPAAGGSRETLNETADYLPLTICTGSSSSSSSSSCSGGGVGNIRDSCASTDSHLYENAVLMVRDPNYTALDPATRCGVRQHTDYAAL